MRATLAELGGLADTGATEHQNRLPTLDNVADDIDRPKDRAANAQGQPDHSIPAVADTRDAMKGSLDPRAVVKAKVRDALGDMVDVLQSHFIGGVKGIVTGGKQLDLKVVAKACLSRSPEVQHQLQQIRVLFQIGRKCRLYPLGENRQDLIQVIGDLALR